MSVRRVDAHPSLNDVACTYGRFVSSVCRRMIQDRELARDAAQEVWVQVVKGYPKFRGESRLSTWIYSITYRVCVDYARHEKRYSTRFLRSYFSQGELPVPVSDDGEKRQWVREMCDKCLTGVLHCLDTESRLAYLFRDVVQLPYEDIAHVLGKDGTAVRQLVSRSRKKLKNFLSGQCILFNPQGACYCRMKKHVCEVNLHQEYQKIRELANRANLYRESEQLLPTMAYVGALVDSLRRYTQEGILEKVTEEKRKEQQASASQRLSQFGIAQPEQVFTRLSDLFNCARWEVDNMDGKISATANGCMLCAAAKKLNTGSPCRIYCLDPMDAMVRALDPALRFKVTGTLWDGDQCRVEVAR